MTKIKRCEWCESGNEAYVAYHDKEWGRPATDDRTQFEFLILEGAQAGLSWSTVLNKRAGYRRHFAQFDAQKVARFAPSRVDRILLDPGIIRNRLKVESAVTNARRFLEVADEYGSFARYIWGFVDGQPVQNRWRKMSQVPATSKHSDTLSADMKKRGFKFVGSTIMYAHMQATGMVNDHIVDCFRHNQVARLAARISW